MQARTRMLLGAVLLALVAGATVLGLAAPAGAHSGEQSYIYLGIRDHHIEGRVEYPIDQLNEVLDLSIPQDEEGALTAVAADLDRIQAYTDAHLAIGDGTTDWPIELDGFFVREFGVGSYAVLEFEVLERFDSVPRQFTVSYDAIFDVKRDADALLVIESDWGAGVFENESSELLRYTRGDTTQVVDLDDSSWWKGMRAVIELGIDHIETGTDHILFIIALVIPSVLVYRRDTGWQPSPSFGASLWRVLKIATMFTVAHSVTLVLAGSGLVDLPAKPVEFLIAISIALAALHNFRPVFFNREWPLAFGFGLFHGLGFAGLLSDLGLDRTNRFQSLLGFNVGIELGQVVIILLVFPVVFVLRRTRVFLPLFRAGSLALAVVATGWGFERLTERDLRVNRIVDPVFLWPRAFWAMLVVGAVATAWYLWEARRQRLLPLPAPAGESAEPKAEDAVAAGV